MSRNHRLVRNALAAAIALATQSALAIEVTREFSGLWLDRDILGHGINVEIIDSPQGKTAAVVWYTFGSDGAPIWVAGSAPVTGTKFDVPVFTLSATVQPGPFGSPGGGQFQPFGTLRFDFKSCESATVTYDPLDPAWANGTMSLTRGTRRYAAQCTGGISDDRPTSASDVEVERFLTPVGNVGQTRARAEFQQHSDHSEFTVEVEDLPVGNYSLRVAGIERGTIEVVPIPGGTKGETEFRSPAESESLLLDFDPRGETVEILDANGVLFAGVLNDSSGSVPSSEDGPGTGNAMYLLKLEPMGENGPEFEAVLEQHPNRTEFSVEIEDAAPGNYVLRVAGIDRGMIDVTSIDGGTHGEIEFQNPPETGTLPLDFDPRGQSIEAVLDGVVVFSSVFPTVPIGPADDDWGGDDDSHDDSHDDSNDDNSHDDDSHDDNSHDDNSHDDDSHDDDSLDDDSHDDDSHDDDSHDDNSHDDNSHDDDDSHDDGNDDDEENGDG